MSRDQYDRRCRRGSVAVELLDEVETAVTAEVDVHERDVGAQLRDTSHGSTARSCDAHHAGPLALEQSHGRVEEIGIVVDDYATQRLIC